MKESSIFEEKNHESSAWENAYFLAFVKTLILWSKNHSFLYKISKNHLFRQDYTKKPKSQEVRFLNKKPWIIPLGKYLFFGI